MASPKPDRTISADFFFWLQTNLESSPKSKVRFTPCQAIKTNSEIRAPISDFATRIGEIIPNIPYLCEAEVLVQKRAIFPIFPLF